MAGPVFAPCLLTEERVFTGIVDPILQLALARVAHLVLMHFVFFFYGRPSD
jgi:hypothetical protein